MTDRPSVSSSTVNAAEIQEWLEALNDVVEFEGSGYAEELLAKLLQHANSLGVSPATQSINTPYVNTLSPEQQAPLPDDGQMLEKLTALMRWNAIAMVMRAGKFASELGGHIASFGSVATLFEVGLTYFFKGSNHPDGSDLIFFQGHSSPGIYARAFLEGRLTEEHLAAFRQEIKSDKGLSSYPHPWLMPDFWQLPTVSMGLGPLMGIYQAHFLRYLNNRGLANTAQRKVWVFCGDGEMGEPESLGALNLAGREQLDNLIFVINCNLQRLDGPVWGNGQIIQEYEGVFRGAGWNVIKVIWGSGWDQLFARDTQGLLRQRMSELVDGEFQNYNSKDGAYLRENFFGKYPELKAMVADLSDEALKALLPGGHDARKVFAAYQAAVNHKGQPTVILAKTIKGFGMGVAGEGLNVTHQTKKMSVEALYHFRERFNLPVSDQHIENLDFYKPAPDSPEIRYLQERRQALGGYVPSRPIQDLPLIAPPLSAFASQLESSGEREVSTTMAFVRILGILLKDPNLQKHIVPVVADESRTFGMEGLFRQLGIYSVCEQKYTPEDREQLLYYRETPKGQLLQEGISEAGAMSSWIAAAVSYATNNLPMIPFYIYYSMFGYQRFGDLCWAAGDMRARGFILGGTAGRTTLAGEGLQHQDGHNLLMFSFVPNCVSYDPAFAYELAVIIQHGLQRMYANQEDIYYYITLMNENYVQPAMPVGVEEDIIKGLYLFKESTEKRAAHVQLLGGGTILREVIKAAEILEHHYQVSADVWGVTSFNELRRDIRAVRRHNRLNPNAAPRLSHVEQRLSNRVGPVIAATDYIQLYAEQIRSDIKARYYVLGTDGFGRSDTREQLRYFFEVDAKSIAYTALKALYKEGKIDLDLLLKAKQQLDINAEKPDPVTV
ncbi:MAG TPA: pyruvate dehydrogenase (acetyl-transferring), homodimeric type [Coxiellaceae bacterium]|nr:pyruvate dehydrogenase (acetyl-transferring), homodimeric type [Coxiellaceae bacterium]